MMKRISAARPNRTSPGSRRRSCSLCYGFTLVEVMTITAIVFLHVTILLPSISMVKIKDQGIMCMNNTKLLLVAWRLYSQDNQEYIPHATGEAYGWVGKAFLNYNEGNPSNYDVDEDIKKSAFWKYTGGTVGIYKCPSDKSVALKGNKNYPRVRTMSMNVQAGGFEGRIAWNPPKWRMYQKTSDFIDPGPSSTWIFIDEREDSINDGAFVTEMVDYKIAKKSNIRIIDYPGSYHDEGASFAFVDGHTEIKRWLDRRTKPVIIPGTYLPLNVASPNNLDVVWIQDRTTSIVEE